MNKHIEPSMAKILNDYFSKRAWARQEPCPECVKHAGEIYPSHDGSRNCESGSIASVKVRPGFQLSTRDQSPVLERLALTEAKG